MYAIYIPGSIHAGWNCELCLSAHGHFLAHYNISTLDVSTSGALWLYIYLSGHWNGSLQVLGLVMEDQGSQLSCIILCVGSITMVHSFLLVHPSIHSVYLTHAHFTLSHCSAQWSKIISLHCARWASFVWSRLQWYWIQRLWCYTSFQSPCLCTVMLVVMEYCMWRI